MDYSYGKKKYAGTALAALIIFGAVTAALVVVPHAAYAATSITTSADKFYGPNLLRVVITDTAKNTATDTALVHVDFNHLGSPLGSADYTIKNIGTSGTFEFFITTSNTLNPTAPTFTGTGGAFVLRANTVPTTVNTNDQGVTLASQLQDQDSIVITYGDLPQKTVSFAKSNAVANVDRNTAGSGDNVVLTLVDSDANIDPTKADIFNATNLVSASTGTLTLSGAKFRETGQNTGQFELTVAVAGPAPLNGASLTATFPSSTTLTINDKDVYVAGNGPAPFDVVGPNPSTITSSKSVTLQNVDGVLTTLKPITLGNGIMLQVTDSDRNVDTKSKDTIGVGNVTVQVDGVTMPSPMVNAIPLQETASGSGIFVPNTTDNKISIKVGPTDNVTTTSIQLTPATIASDPDITITYNDPAADPSGAKAFKLITKLTHSAGTLAGPTQAGVTDKFGLTITDPDLNTNSKSVDSFIVTFPVSPANTANGVSFANGMGTMTLKAKGSGLTLGSALTMTFIETDIDSGIFTASNIDMSIINAAVSGGLSDGDQIEFKYTDNTESPTQSSTITFNIGKPTASISINRGTIPIPTAGTGSKFTVTIVDSTKNVNSNSVDTFSTGVTIAGTKKDGSSNLDTTIMTGLGAGKTFTETGANTGVFTADYTVGSGTQIAANMDSAKIKFTYTTGGTTTSASVTLRSYDGTVLSNVSSVQNGGNITITVNDPDMNKDSGTAEQVSVTIQGKSDDIGSAITLSDLKETGSDTGVFTKTITVGKDFKISDLTNNKFSTAFEIHYVDLLASDLSTSVDREFDGTVKTSSGTIGITPTIVGPGTKIFIEVKDPDLNANPAGIDTTASGVEYIRITSDRSGANTLTTALGEETGSNTGIFRTKLTLNPITGATPSPLFPPNTTKEVTGFVLPGDILSIRYTDQKDASGSKATVSQVIKVISQDPVMNSSKVTIDANGSVQVTVTDADANTDGDAVDSITLKVTSTTDPVGISVTALETGANTGVFRGTVTTTTGVTTGSVSAKVGDNVNVKYTDKYPADYADRVKQVVDPSKDFTFVIPVGTSSGSGNVDATSAAKPVLKDFSGNELTEVTAGQQIVLSSTVTNNQNTVQPFAAIVEVRDANGFTVYLQWQTGSLNPNGSTNVGLSWTPDVSGTYTARTFVVTDIAHPSALSQISESTITVS
ncbi:hypothetical protein NTE_00702 [Candidatus Nitrososphaera evergladensis SR1]|uniref:Uncharacterized protein n=1 Tax=Candidatus Nitrososphaera evergladensis SR1 TaxID=1459636 RepID=A0A075MPM5_9ARCH|nr:hypothetical protein [Candidatus Nitrososphaera evergladensis]AIF82782.1 hypothetical protein NTE_00702 [Candidatus Nitrososphaera evergladensis SR1]